jgi:hypothetical protein
MTGRSVPAYRTSNKSEFFSSNLMVMRVLNITEIEIVCMTWVIMRQEISLLPGQFDYYDKKKMRIDEILAQK